MAKEEQKQYNDKVKSKFSESLYQHMASRRFGIDFCCDTAKKLWEMKNDLLNLNNISDAAECRTICPEEASNCSFSCVDINYCNLNFYEFISVMGNLGGLIDAYNDIYSYETTNPELFQDLLNIHECWIIEQESSFSEICEGGLIFNCHYTQSCYDGLIQTLQAIEEMTQEATACTDEGAAEREKEYQDEKKFLIDCENQQLDLLNQLDALTANKEDLEEQIANETDPLEIEKLQAVLADVIDEINDVENQLAIAVSGCGGDIVYIQERIDTIDNNQNIIDQISSIVRERLEVILEELTLMASQLDETAQGEGSIFSCAQIFTFVAGSYVNYTACSGSSASSILGENARIYVTLNSTFTYSSNTFSGTEEVYEQLAEKLFEVLPECNELPECANDPLEPGEGEPPA
jgi:hypothetical protein